jgi:hypothetical protein
VDQATLEKELAFNQQAYQTLQEQIRREHSGQLVALAGGRVVAASSDIDAIYAAVAELEPMPDYFVIFAAESMPIFPYNLDYLAYEREIAINCKGWKAIRDEVHRDYAGQYVAMSYGRIIASGPTYEEVDAAVKHLYPALEDYWVFPADDEPWFQPVGG